MTEAFDALALDNSARAAGLRNAFVNALEAASLEHTLDADDRRRSGCMVMEEASLVSSVDRIGEAVTTRFLCDRRLDRRLAR
ncbi:hypothetical protein [Beijerinckia sp. L45]|uniref:hypothetical protein n=1 Tax=Beijerinckia sp. L45 TaxID=1641855 RepID=UPI00131CF77E|nr:hypothetical protein [Beijerinckia sp. L45]